MCNETGGGYNLEDRMMYDMIPCNKLMPTKQKPSKFIIFNSMGEPDKELVATAVVNNIKRKYPKDSIVVVSNHPEIWLHNPDIFRVYKAGSIPYFFEDFIKGKDSKIFWQDPFNANDAIHRHDSLSKVWSDLCKVPCKETLPKMHFTFREFEATERMLAQKIPLNLRQGLCADYIKNRK